MLSEECGTRDVVEQQRAPKDDRFANHYRDRHRETTKHHRHRRPDEIDPDRVIATTSLTSSRSGARVVIVATR